MPGRNCCLLQAMQAMKEKGCTLIGECRHEMWVQHEPVSVNGASTGQKYVWKEKVLFEQETR